MKLLRGIVVALLLVSLAWAADGLVIKAVMPADQTQGTSDLGSLNVEGVGTVTLMAQRTGTRIVIQALAPDGKVIGQAESVIGPKETLIYVTTPGGLKKLTILWR